MAEHDLAKLLGGFAADTLTPEERKQLYTAALHDQELFNALADEQALKELLADPAVRRRLLQALEQKSSSGAGGPASWLDWFRRPAGLALAGGLAAAALAVVLGTKIYQESLKQVPPSVATEDTRPTTPPAEVAPQPSTPGAEPTAKDKEATRAEAPGHKPAGKRRAAQEPPSKPAVPGQPPVDSLARRQDPPQLRSEESRRYGAPPPAPPELPVEKAPALADRQEQTPTAAPLIAAPKPQSPQNAPAAAVASPARSARALFYGTAPEPAMEQDRLVQPSVTGEQAGAGQMAETPLREKKRADRHSGALGKLERAKQPAGKPLGLRYSVIMAGPGGIDLEVDPATAVGKDDTPRLAVQTNEDGYLSVLYTRRSSDQPETLFPVSGDGWITGRKPVVIPLDPLFGSDQTAEGARLNILFSRQPRAAGGHPPGDKHAPRLVIEHVDPSQPGAPPEQAVYVVNPDLNSSGYLSIELPLSLRP
jgi:hypothetical protein